MRVRRVGWVLTLLGFSLAIACGGGGSGSTSGGNAQQSMTGRWTGSASSQGVAIALDLTLAEAADGSVSGNGTADLGALGQASVSVTGMHADPDVTLIATAPSFPEIAYTGSFTGPNTIVGTATGEEVPGIPLKLLRH